MNDAQTDLPSTPAITGRHYLIAADGACKGNPGKGGWGVVIQLKYGESIVRQRALAGQKMDTTNNRMELMAAIKGLERVREPLPIIVISDSKYVVLGMTERLERWKTAGWRNSGGWVKNCDLWEELDQLSQPLTIEWEWQRGHVGHDLNETADQLADKAALGKYPHGERSVKKAHPRLFW